MGKTKDYKEKLDDLESGLRQLDNMKPKKYGDYERIRRAREIQEARIDGFKSGHSLKVSEIMGQNGLNLRAKK